MADWVYQAGDGAQSDADYDDAMGQSSDDDIPDECASDYIGNEVPVRSKKRQRTATPVPITQAVPATQSTPKPAPKKRSKRLELVPPRYRSELHAPFTVGWWHEMTRMPGFWLELQRRTPPQVLRRTFQVQMIIPEESRKNEDKAEKAKAKQSVQVSDAVSSELSAGVRPTRVAARSRMPCGIRSCEFFANDSGYCSECLATLDDGDGLVERMPVMKRRPSSSIIVEVPTKRTLRSKHEPSMMDVDHEADKSMLDVNSSTPTSESAAGPGGASAQGPSASTAKPRRSLKLRPPEVEELGSFTVTAEASETRREQEVIKPDPDLPTQAEEHGITNVEDVEMDGTTIKEEHGKSSRMFKVRCLGIVDEDQITREMHNGKQVILVYYRGKYVRVNESDIDDIEPIKEEPIKEEPIEALSSAKHDPKVKKESSATVDTGAVIDLLGDSD